MSFCNSFFAADTLKAGRYSWPFTVRLPPYIPATFEGHNGRVMYWAKLTVERPWKGDFEHTRNFIVLGALDLNTEADAKVGADKIFKMPVLSGEPMANN